MDVATASLEEGITKRHQFGVVLEEAFLAIEASTKTRVEITQFIRFLFLLRARVRKKHLIRFSLELNLYQLQIATLKDLRGRRGSGFFGLLDEEFLRGLLVGLLRCFHGRPWNAIHHVPRCYSRLSLVDRR